MPAVMRQSLLRVDARAIKPVTSPSLENNMLRIALTCCFALLASCGTQSVSKIDWAQARLACADVGIEPGSSSFDQCVADLYNSLWTEQYLTER
jgi:hypothetical protein